MSNKYSKNTEKFVLLSLFVCALSALPALSGAVSLTWGHVGKYASPIYDEEIKLTDNKPIVDVTYPRQGDTSEYIITAMHAFDAKTPLYTTAVAERAADAHLATVDSARVMVLRGGVGFNYTTLRFEMPTSAYQLSAADSAPTIGGHPDGGRHAGRGNNLRAHYQLVIYGVDL
ncbi:uncharacterized protein LOC126756290 [Bactrocera neohumeralis]|uniref:uncharacterized protein LOC126756290 n=1 Tax=Bactrocera neohumeralis TaxID=98809 RepID=UPI002165DAD2|nr:uncharacterized protein LOC126756290 [Bactrocera neohumeralis]